MGRFAIRGLLSRKLRTALTAIAIVLGVAMISGTFILTDSIDQAFDRIFTDIRQGSNAVVSGKSAFDFSDQQGVGAPLLDESLLEEVRALPGVAEAEGNVDSDATQLIGDDGKAVVSGGAPNLGFSIANGDSVFNPLTLLDGGWPGPNEVAIDKETAADEDFEVGETVGVQAEGPVERLRVSGIVQFSSGLTIGGATLAGFDLPTAQRLFQKVGKLDEIAVAAKPGVTDEQLIGEIEEILPSDAQVLSGTEQAQDDAEDTDEFISFLRAFLLAFGGIALFVGSFVIANSLSITIAQRTREFATLRTIGATNRQILGSVIVEALVVGVVASIIGLFLGLLLAEGLFGLFDAVGFTLPNAGLVFEPRAVVVALAAGIFVTLLASVYPGLRATTVPPIAAVREGAVLPGEPLDRVRGQWLAVAVTALGVGLGVFAISTRPANTFLTIVLAVLGLILVLFGGALFPSRTLGALVSGALGFAALLYGLFVPDLGTTSVLLWMGVGVLLVFFGVARVTTRLIPRLSVLMSPIARWTVFLLSVIFWPFFTLPYWLLRYGAWGPGSVLLRILAFLGGALLNPLLLPIVVVMWVRKAVSRWEPEWPMEFPGVVPDRSTTRVGSENARRNPQRTASTAAALMIGLALVTLVATLAAGIIASFEGAVNDLFTGDYAITAQNNFSPIPIDAAEAAAQAPGVTAVGNVRTGEALVFGDVEFATAVDPGMAQVISMDWKEGSQEVFSELGDERRVRRRLVRRRPQARARLARRGHVRERDDEAVHGEGHLRPADGRLALRRGHDVGRGLGQPDSAAAEPLLVREDARRRDGREPGRARRRAGRLPEREGADQAAVHRQPDRRAQRRPQHPLRAARAVRDREPVRDREHARADGLRAHPRDRDAACDRDDPEAGAPHDPARERHHRAHRRGARDRARHRPRGAAHRPRRLPRLLVPDESGDRVRHRGDRRRDRGGDLPCAPRRQARPARSYRVRMTPSAASAAISSCA